MKEKEVKSMPIFWTFMMNNGVVSFHQVKFKAIIINPFDKNSDGTQEIDFAVFNIAGRPETFIGRGAVVFDGLRVRDYKDDSSKKYYPLDLVFETKEQAIRASKARTYNLGEEGCFRGCGDSFTYKITESNPLYGNSAWWWGKHTPSNLMVYEWNDGHTRLSGYRWNGTNVVLSRVEAADGEKMLQLVDGVKYSNQFYEPLFDMVSCSWLTNFKHRYYSSREECESDNETKVFVFDD